MLALLISHAFALSCIEGVAGTNLDADLPTNGVIVYSVVGPAPAAPAVLDADGLEVPATVTDHGAFQTVTPDELLQPGSYTLVVGSELPFTVSGEEDLDAPEAPTFLSLERDTSRSEWGTERQLRMAFDPLARGEHLEIELSESGDFAADGVRVVSFYEELSVGDGLCATIPSSYQHEIDYVVRARTVDAAGNTSPWVEEEPAPRGLGCSTSGAPVAGLWGLVGLLGLRRARR